MSLFYNFVVERLGIEPHELGGLEALREVPGFLNVLFLLLMQLLVHQLKFQQLTVVKQKLKYLLELKVVNNLG